TRSATGQGAPYLLAIAVRAAARAASQAALDAAHWAFSLRSSRLAHDAAEIDRRRPAALEVRRGAEAVVQVRFRLFRRLGRRRSAGDLERQTGAQHGRGDLRPPSLRLGAA